MRAADSVLFVTKLLPMFVYPLGLVCLALLAVCLGGARRRWQSMLLWAALLVLWLASSRWVGFALARPLESRHLSPAQTPLADAIVVLGGGTRPALPPRSGVEVNEAGDRMLRAAELYHAGKAPLVIVSAGRVPWMESPEPEAADIATLLRLLGVPTRAIVEEGHSRNTEENAVETRRLLEERGIRRVLLVTSALHMSRAIMLFREQSIEVVPEPTDFMVTQADPHGFRDGSFEGVLLGVLPDADCLSFTTRVLKEYLGLAVHGLRGLLRPRASPAPVAQRQRARNVCASGTESRQSRRAFAASRSMTPV